jgi:hypothetical protein
LITKDFVVIHVNTQHTERPPWLILEMERSIDAQQDLDSKSKSPNHSRILGSGSPGSGEHLGAGR